MPNNTNCQPHLVFIGGSPRSGTTLLQRILNGHPDIYGGPEFDFTSAIVALHTAMQGGIDSGRIDAWLTQEECTASFRHFIRHLFSHKSQQTGKKVICEKTPSNAEVAKKLQHILPESSFILVLRDPRDIVVSMLEVGRKARQNNRFGPSFTRDTRSACWQIMACVQGGLERIAQDSKACMVFYEDLTQNPTAEANKIFSKIGLSPLENLDLNAANYEHCKNEASWKDWETGKTNANVDPNNQGQYKNKLSSSQTAYINDYFSAIPIIQEHYIQSTPSTFQKLQVRLYKVLYRLHLNKLLEKN